MAAVEMRELRGRQLMESRDRLGLVLRVEELGRLGTRGTQHEEEDVVDGGDGPRIVEAGFMQDAEQMLDGAQAGG